MTGREPAAAVLTVGDELLSGEVADTNFPLIRDALREIGVETVIHLTVGDSRAAIEKAVRVLLQDADVVVVTGGLGPTADDLTAEAVAAGLGRDLEFRREIADRIRAFFESMNRRMSEENLKQAFLPEGSKEIPPAGGTAPGFMIEEGDRLVAVLPGVPREMESMLVSHVVPLVKDRFGGGSVTVTRRLMAFGAGESDIAGLVSDLVEEGRVRYGFLIMDGPVAVKMTATAETREGAVSILEEERKRVKERLGPFLYSDGDRQMEEVLGDLLREKGLTLAVAESCTGGLVCGRLTNVPGSSEYFLGGVVTYSIRSKIELLGLSGELFANGAVNKDVAAAMARGVREVFGSDIGIGVTGVAGPETGGEKKPPGTVCLGVSDPGGSDSWELRLPGDRSLFRNLVAVGALNAVRLRVIFG